MLDKAHINIVKGNTDFLDYKLEVVSTGWFLNMRFEDILDNILLEFFFLMHA